MWLPLGGVFPRHTLHQQTNFTPPHCLLVPLVGDVGLCRGGGRVVAEHGSGVGGVSPCNSILTSLIRVLLMQILIVEYMYTFCLSFMSCVVSDDGVWSMEACFWSGFHRVIPSKRYAW